VAAAAVAEPSPLPAKRESEPAAQFESSELARYRAIGASRMESGVPLRSRSWRRQNRRSLRGSPARRSSRLPRRSQEARPVCGRRRADRAFADSEENAPLKPRPTVARTVTTPLFATRLPDSGPGRKAGPHRGRCAPGPSSQARAPPGWPAGCPFTELAEAPFGLPAKPAYFAGAAHFRRRRAPPKLARLLSTLRQTLLLSS
jgi:hypothetical protein